MRDLALGTNSQKLNNMNHHELHIIMISLGAYEYNGADVLGSGAFAIVYKGQLKENPDKKVAIKRMLKDHNIMKSKTLLSKEIAVLKDLCHENIVRLYDNSITTQGVYLVMEYCNGGDLSDYLHRLKTLSEDTLQHFLIQIGSSMAAMNTKGIMHRDLKPGNILLCYPSLARSGYRSIADIPGTQITFKLADFGFARFLQDGMMAVTMCGSPMYMAPEVLMCWKYDALADIWSLGIIVYQCLTGKAPFYANTPEALKNIYVKTPTLRPKIPSTTSALLKDLLLRMLVRNPRDRIDFKAFLEHPFLKKKEPPIVSDPISMKRRSSSGCDIRMVTKSPQSGNGFPSTAPSSAPRYADMMRDFASPPKPIQDGFGRGEKVLVEDNQFPDYVIVNSDGSAATPTAKEVSNPPALADPARKLFDASSGSTSEVSANLLDTCNTSPDYRRRLSAVGSNSGSQQHLRSSSQLSGGSNSPARGPNQGLVSRPRPPSYPAYIRDPTPYQIVLKNSDSGDIPGSSPIDSHARFYVGSTAAGTHASSYSSSSGPASPHSPAARFGLPSSGPSARPRSHSAVLPPSQTESRNTVVPNSDQYSNINPDLFMPPPELSEEALMEPAHNDELQKVTMVLELCELLTELAEQRSTPLSASVIGGRGCGADNETNQEVIQFASEPQRIVEQVVLYKRVLQYLEFFFFQVKTAFQEGRLKPTRTARQRLKDCNAIYHRCYIRLRHLARDSQVPDVVDDVAHFRSSVTADKLIFQYALDQCSAAEMDDFVGEIDMCLRRYKAAMTLLHGLCQHARTDLDRERLNHYMGLVQDRYARLWNTTVPTAHSPEGSP